MPTKANVEKNDLTSGKHAKLFATVTDQDYTAVGYAGTYAQRVARRVVVPSGGALTIVLCDGTNLTLPDPGGAFAWDIQHIGLKASGSVATNVVVIW